MNQSKLRVALLTMLAGVGLHAGASTPTRPTPNFEVNAPLWKSGTYTYDGAGNILTIGDDAYDYDLAGRVTAGTAHTTTHANAQTFEYDIYGNLKTIQTKSDFRPATNAPWVASRLTIDSATNRVVVSCGQGDCYDQSGNLLNDGATAYAWDLLGNMQQLTTAGRQERYLYDASNERIATITVAGASHEYRRYTIRGVNQKVLREATDEVNGATHTWKWNKDYVHRDGSLIASVVPTDAAATAEEASHFHLDHLGTARVMTDANGYRRSMNTYYPFGREAAGSDFNRERMRFTGHERDFGATPAHDLDYMHARYYKVAWGRFLSVDNGSDWEAGDPQSWNLYAYTRNNPVSFVDTDGRAQRAMSMRAADYSDKNDCMMDILQNYVSFRLNFGPQLQIGQLELTANVSVGISGQQWPDRGVDFDLKARGAARYDVSGVVVGASGQGVGLATNVGTIEKKFGSIPEEPKSTGVIKNGRGFGVTDKGATVTVGTKLISGTFGLKVESVKQDVSRAFNRWLSSRFVQGFVYAEGVKAAGAPEHRVAEGVDKNTGVDKK